MAETMTAGKKLINPAPVIAKLADMALQAKGRECSLLGIVIDMLRSAPDATDNNVGCKWIPVTERLPDKMGQYICQYVFGDQTEYPFYQVLWYFTAIEKPHFQHEGSMGLRVTHWMPLPTLPEEDD